MVSSVVARLYADCPRKKLNYFSRSGIKNEIRLYGTAWYAPRISIFVISGTRVGEKVAVQYAPRISIFVISGTRVGEKVAVRYAPRN
jgi:hypothetical protein